MMFNDIKEVDYINIGLSLITAISTSYLAYAALKHSARPRAKVYIKEPFEFIVNRTILIKFAFKNVGYWYSKQIVVNMTVFINFDNQFVPIQIFFGSVQEYQNNLVRNGKGRMKFLKARGIKLTYDEEYEEVHVKVKLPQNPGKYKIIVSAYSENGLYLFKKFIIKVNRAIKNND